MIFVITTSSLQKVNNYHFIFSQKADLPVPPGLKPVKLPPTKPHDDPPAETEPACIGPMNNPNPTIADESADSATSETEETSGFIGPSVGPNNEPTMIGPVESTQPPPPGTVAISTDQ